MLKQKRDWYLLAIPLKHTTNNRRALKRTSGREGCFLLFELFVLFCSLKKLLKGGGQFLKCHCRGGHIFVWNSPLVNAVLFLNYIEMAMLQYMFLLLQLRMYTYPPGVCIKVYDLLISHIERHYLEPKDNTSNTASAARKLVGLSTLTANIAVVHIVIFYQMMHKPPTITPISNLKGVSLVLASINFQCLIYFITCQNTVPVCVNLAKLYFQVPKSYYL